MKRRKITGLIACIVLIACLTGCAELGSALNDMQGGFDRKYIHNQHL